MTTKELETRLATSRNALLASIDGLNEQQLSFRPDAEAWSITGVLEHLVIVEGRAGERLQQLSSGAESAPSQGEMDQVVIARVPDRTNRFKTPAPGEPRGGVKVPDLLARLEQLRNENLHLLQTVPLRGRTSPHPVLGPLDGTQWFLALAGHMQRHTAQIEEVKASPDFPKAPEMAGRGR